MKTPMQEHIEWLKKERDLHGYERGIHYEMAIEHAESLLEKEEERISGNVRQQSELLLQAYKEGFDAATDSLIGANKVVQEKKLQQ